MKKSIDDTFMHNLKRVSVLPQRSVTINSSLYSKAKVNHDPFQKMDRIQLHKRQLKTQTNWKDERRKTFEDFLLHGDQVVSNSLQFIKVSKPTSFFISVSRKRQKKVYHPRIHSKEKMKEQLENSRSNRLNYIKSQLNRTLKYENNSIDIPSKIKPRRNKLSVQLKFIKNTKQTSKFSNECRPWTKRDKEEEEFNFGGSPPMALQNSGQSHKF